MLARALKAPPLGRHVEQGDIRNMDSPIAHVDSGALEYKVLVLGCTMVGKTSLIRRYTTGKSPTSTVPTIGKRPVPKLLVLL